VLQSGVSLNDYSRILFSSHNIDFRRLCTDYVVEHHNVANLDPKFICPRDQLETKVERHRPHTDEEISEPLHILVGSIEISGLDANEERLLA
jgi:hypothetical protein